MASTVTPNPCVNFELAVRHLQNGKQDAAQAALSFYPGAAKQVASICAPHEIYECWAQRLLEWGVAFSPISSLLTPIDQLKTRKFQLLMAARQFVPFLFAICQHHKDSIWNWGF